MGTTLDGLLTFSELYKRQSNFFADALRVLMVGFDGANYNVVNIDSSGAISTSGGGSEVATAADGGAAPALYKVIAGVDPDTSLVQSIATSSVGVLRVADCSASGNFSAHGTHADALLTSERGFVQKSVLYGYNGTDIDLIRTSEAGTSLTKGILATALYYFDSVGGNWDRIHKGQQTGAESLPVVLASDTALPAGTNAIGKLAANSGVDIGDVDVTSIIPGTGATNLGKAIDTATGGTDTGVLALGTRDDSLSTLTPADGDNVQIRTNSRGSVWNEHDLAPGTFTTLMNAQTLQNTTETNGGTDLTCNQSWVEFEVSISKTGSPTRFQVFLNWANDGGTNYARSDHGWEQQIFYVAAEVSGTIYRSFLTPRRGGILRVSAQASGTASASHYFTVTIKARTRSSG